jgi:hypothetical protein
VAGLLEKALPVEDDPLYRIALEVEQDAALNAEMREWREGLVADGIRGLEDTGPAGGDDATR